MPPMQVPMLQASPVVQALPSLQAEVVNATAQVAVPLHVRVLQVSLVQVMAVPAQTPFPLQRSVCVQATPSSQAVLLPTLAQTPPAAHRPVVCVQMFAGAGVRGAHMASEVPGSTAEQVPSVRPLVVLLQASHGPLQARSQHTPSAHESPVSQSDVTLQV